MNLVHILLAAAGDASACAVCFSGKAPNIGGLITGFTVSIFFLLTVTMSILAGICAVVLRVERERAAADAAQPS